MNGAPTQDRLASLDLEYLFSYWATLAPPEVIGPIAEGIRVNFYVTAGEVSGPKCEAGLGPWAATGYCFVPTASACLTFAQLWSWMTGL